MMEKVRKLIWKKTVLIPDHAVIPVLVTVPVILFALFVWMAYSLSAVQ